MAGREAMALSDVVDRICRIPGALRERGDVSVYELVRTSGYQEHRAAITRDSLLAVLSRDAVLVEEWIAYSQDKRTSSGWAMSELFGGGYAVGFYPSGQPTRFEDKAAACAEFVLQEIASVLESVEEATSPWDRR